MARIPSTCFCHFQYGFIIIIIIIINHYHHLEKEQLTCIDPSPVLRMGNIISLEDLEEDDDYEALLEDLKEGCNQFGTVQSLKVPRIKVHFDLKFYHFIILSFYHFTDHQQEEEEVPGVGYAFVQYSSVLEAASAARNLRLKTFNGKQVQVDYYPLSLYTRDVGRIKGKHYLQEFGEVGELI